MTTLDTQDQIDEHPVEAPLSTHPVVMIPWLAIPVPITIETVYYAALFILAAITRFWGLGLRVMSHDESLHVYFSWLLATGKGYTHNPMMHGPLLFEATALVDRIFSANDFASRLIPALVSLLVVVGVPLLLRPWLGRWGAASAGLMFLISPVILFYSRYIRHDLLVITWVLVLVFALLKYLSSREDRYLTILAIALALMFATMETTFIYLAIFAGFLLVHMLATNRLNWKAIRASAEFDLIVVLSTLGAFFSSPIALLVLNPLWKKLTGAVFVDVNVLAVQGTEWSTGPAGQRLWILLGIFAAAAILIGLLWDWKRWVNLAAIFLAITVVTFTTFFTNPTGIGTGLIGSLGYWLSQQAVARGSQPWYYFLVVFPFYEFLPIIGGIMAIVYSLFRHKQISQPSRTFFFFSLWWAAGIFAAFTMAGEKMPWHVTHLVVPFILLAAWFVGQMIPDPNEEADTEKQKPGLARWSALAVIALLLIVTARSSYLANFVNYDYTTEFIDYAHGAPAVKWVLNDLEKISTITGAGKDIKVAYDQDVAWPMTWYLRDYKNQVFYNDSPDRQTLDVPVIIAGPKTWPKVENLIGPDYHIYEVIRLWWPMEDYKLLTWDRIRNAMTNPEMRSALWKIFWSRDYSSYAALTGETLNPPHDWPLAERMRVYIRKDIDTSKLSLQIAGYQLPDIAKKPDPYAALKRTLAPTQIDEPIGLNSPRNVAVARDGSLWVADTGNSRIIKLSTKGDVIQATIGTRTPDGQNPPATATFNEPWGLAVDPQGNLYVADTWNHRIQKFDAQGNFLLQWGVPGQSSEGADRFWGPRQVAIGPEGHVYVTDTGNKRVVAFDESGKFLFQFDTTGDAQLNEPVGIAVGPDGKVYIADTWNMRVVIFTSNGKFQSAWPVQAWNSASLDNKPYLVVDSQSRVYLTDPEGYRVLVFSAQGEALLSFGDYGPEVSSFGMPNGLALAPDGSLWVSDAGNNRAVRFSNLLQ